MTVEASATIPHGGATIRISQRAGEWVHELWSQGSTTASPRLLSGDEFVAMVRACDRRQRWFPAYLALAAVLAFTLIASLEPLPASLLIALIGLLSVPVYRWDRRRRELRLEFDLSDVEVRRRCDLVAGIAGALVQTASLWEVASQVHTYDWKNHGGAGALVQRAPVRLTVEAAPLRANVRVPTLTGATRCMLLPHCVVVGTGAQLVCMPHEWLGIEVSTIDFVEYGVLPRDAFVAGSTWQHVNRNGGPDRRFSQNRQLPIARYGYLRLMSRSGFALAWNTSSANAALHIANTLRALQARGPVRPPPPAMVDQKRSVPPTADAMAARPVPPPPPPPPPAPHHDALARVVPPASAAAARYAIPTPGSEPPSESHLAAPSAPARATVATGSADSLRDAAASVRPYVAQAAPSVPTRVREPGPPPVPVVARHSVSEVEPAAPSAAARWRWVPPGEDVRIKGAVIPGGMLYVGSGLNAARRQSLAEPALVDPALPYRFQDADHAGALMTYWPRYDNLDPRSRGAYIEWLRGGRRDPGAYIGYVFLFFYGLERRLLDDSVGRPDRAETNAIVREIERLLDLYGANASFHGYATDLLACTVARGTVDPSSSTHGGGTELAGGLSTALRASLAHVLASNTLVPAALALAWTRAVSEVPRRTPAQRCHREFENLFAIRYAARHREGLRLATTPGTPALTYKCASPGFGGAIAIAGLADVSENARYVAQLSEIARECSEALEPLSRWRGKYGTGGDTAASVALLPRELLRANDEPSLAALRTWLEKQFAADALAVTSGRDLLEHRGVAPNAKLSKSDAVLLAQLLAGLGYGIEPDVRFGGPTVRADEPVVLFRLDAEAAASPSDGFRAASVLLALGAAVATADGVVSESEVRQLNDQVDQLPALDPSERTRLRAHARWLLARKPSAAALKRIVAGIPTSQRAAVAQFLVTVAGADGRIDPAEITVLTRLYALLGLERDAVYADVHALATGDQASVRRSQPGPAPLAMTPGPVVLDPAKLAAKQSETAAVANLLGAIFTDEEPSTTPPPVQPPRDEPPLAGLDTGHSMLLRRFATRESWPRCDVETVCAELHLMPDGALDRLNDAAYDRCGAPLLDGDDPITVDTAVLKEMTT